MGGIKNLGKKRKVGKKARDGFRSVKEYEGH